MKLLERIKYTFGGAYSSKALYGIILISVTLIGFQAHETKALTIALKTFLAASIIVIAEVYSEILGESIQHHKVLKKAERNDIEHNAGVIMSVALYPTFIFLGSAAGLYSVSTAFTLSGVLGLLALAGFGYYAIKSSGATGRQALVKGSVLAVIGSLIIIAKFMTGH